MPFINLIKKRYRSHYCGQNETLKRLIMFFTLLLGTVFQIHMRW